jgi:hypothetical protein
MTSQCVGKMQHQTLDAAEIAARSLKKNGKNKKRRMRIVAYKCPLGEHWHVGHSRPTRDKRRTDA